MKVSDFCKYNKCTKDQYNHCKKVKSHCYLTTDSLYQILIALKTPQIVDWLNEKLKKLLAIFYK